MTSIHGDALTAGPALALATTVDAAEALCFARDLGGSLTHVLVAATGRALAVDPVRTGASRPAAVALALGSSSTAGVAVLAGACDASLPALRGEIDAVLRGAVEAAGASSPDDPVAIVVVETDRPHPAVEELLRRSPCVLEAGPCEGDPLTLALTLRADRRSLDPARAEALLGRIARLLAQPYRRLQ
jgi:hypothetical protein